MLVHPDRLKIVFGTKCNSQCSYCYIDSTVKRDYEISNDFLANLKHYISLYHPLLVYFGGEPLLYWDKFKWLIQNIGDYERQRFVTNGKLLNEDIVDFCNKHSINIEISSDLNTKVSFRKDDYINDILKNPSTKKSKNKLDLLKKIDKFSVPMVATKYNYPKDGFSNLTQILGNKPFYFTSTIIHANNENMHPITDKYIFDKLYIASRRLSKAFTYYSEKEYIPPLSLGSDNSIRYTIDGTLLGFLTNKGLDLDIVKYKRILLSSEYYKKCPNFLCPIGTRLQNKCNIYSHENTKECIIQHETTRFLTNKQSNKA